MNEGKERQSLTTARNIEVEELELFDGDIISVVCIDDLFKPIILSLSKDGARVEYDCEGEYPQGTMKPIDHFVKGIWEDEACREITKLGTTATHRIVSGKVVAK